MKIKQYLNSLVSRRKSSNTSVSQTDCHYEICAYDEPSTTEHQSRTELLLNRHAQLVNTIINIRSQQQTHSYANTLATSNPHRIYHTTTNRQRSKIRTNPWINTISSSSSRIEYANIIHSESFPQTISNNPNHSSSTDNVSSDDHRQHQTDVNRRRKKPNPRHQQRSTNSKKHQYQTRPTSSDEYSQNFENILENQQRNSSSSRKSPFILPLDEIDMKTSRNYSGSLKKTNSHTILKHIEEIENEIQMIKNLNFDCDSNRANRASIHEQVDQWVDQCLTNSKVNLPKQSEIMTAFYLSSIPTAKRTVSYIEQSIPIVNTQTLNKNLKSTQECPF